MLDLPLLFVTFTRNVSVAGPFGAVMSVFSDVGSWMTATGPPTCDQANVSGSCCGSDDPLASSVVFAPDAMVWSGPAFATGGLITTVMLIASGASGDTTLDALMVAL